MMKRIFLALALASLLPGTASGQFGADDDVVDRLLAVVGDSVVVLTQVREEIQRMALGGSPVPAPGEPGYEQLFRTVVNQYVDQLLILQAAAKDTLLQVDEARIGQQVNERISQLAQQFGGQASLQQALAQENLSLAEYREILRNEARKEQVQQMFYQLRTRDASPVEVTDDELRARFEEARTQLQERPRLLSFAQVVVAPTATEDALAQARLTAEGLVERIRAGEDFATLAQEHSQDPGTASLGGDLGWFRRGRMVREFEDAAFNLITGQVSEPVETEYGYHIIKVERVRAGERQARHILVTPTMTEDDLVRARDTAQEVLRRARAGESMADLFAAFSDPAAPDTLTVAFQQLSELPPAYAQLQSATEGAFYGPLEYQSTPTESRIAVVLVTQVREAGPYTFEDVRGQLATQLQQEKQLQRLLDELRATTHVDIRM